LGNSLRTAGQRPRLATVAGVNVLLWAMIFCETASYDERLAART
jgi:hypothetical protein